MTNSSLRFALKCSSAALVALTLVGCGARDGKKELAEAEVAYGVRDLGKADRLLAKSLSYVGDNVDALIWAARVKLELGDLSSAADFLGRAEGLAGGDVDIELLGAQIAYHSKDYAAAAKRFAAVADSRGLSVNLQAEALAGLGVVEMTRNEYDAARIAFLKAIRLDRRNAAARYHLGLLYRDGFGYTEAALEQFEIFVRLETNADVRVVRTQRSIIPELKETLARQAMDRPGASQRDSSAAAAALARATAARKKKDYRTAKREYAQAFAADALSYPAALGLAEMWAATDASLSGQKKTLEIYRSACALNASAVKTLVTTGALAYKLSNYATAVEAYSRAVAANPADLTAIDGLIRSLGKVGGRRKIAAAYQAYRDFVVASRRK